MRNNNTMIITGVAAIAVAVLVFWAVDVDVQGDLEMPEISLETEGGNFPAVDVNTADINVREESATVDVPTGVDIQGDFELPEIEASGGEMPDADVQTEEREFTYPTVDIESPEENTRAEEDDL